MNLSGKLIGEKSAAVVGVKVNILDGGSIISTSSFSASDGTFNCIVTEEWYDKPLVFQVNAPGYHLFQHDLRVQDGGGPYDKYDFQLTPVEREKKPEPVKPVEPPKNALKVILWAIWAFLSIALQGLIVVGCVIFWIIVVEEDDKHRTPELFAAVFVLTALTAFLVYRKVRKRS
ncbi:MAG TPA: hypothetical protein VK961_24045 [Chthoniobacter sp.]|nr:hypothetical protein [Chthoniobacter sp.]